MKLARRYETEDFATAEVWLVAQELDGDVYDVEVIRNGLCVEVLGDVTRESVEAVAGERGWKLVEERGWT